MVGSVRRQLQNEIDDTLQNLNGLNKGKKKPKKLKQQEKEPGPDSAIDTNQLRTFDINVAKIKVSDNI